MARYVEMVHAIPRHVTVLDVPIHPNEGTVYINPVYRSPRNTKPLNAHPALEKDCLNKGSTAHRPQAHQPASVVDLDGLRELSQRILRHHIFTDGGAHVLFSASGA